MTRNVASELKVLRPARHGRCLDFKVLNVTSARTGQEQTKLDTQAFAFWHR